MDVTIIIPWIRRDKIGQAVTAAILNAGVNVVLLVKEDTERIGCPKMVRDMVNECTTKYVCFLGDDTIAGDNYIKIAMDEMLEFPGGNGLIGFNDKTGRTLPTHWIASRELLPELGGTFFHPGYRHCCCDVELLHRVKALGRFSYSQKALVLHDHPMITGCKTDKFYDYVYSPLVRGKDQALLKQRMENGWSSA